MTHDPRQQIPGARVRALGVVAVLGVVGLLVGCAGTGKRGNIQRPASSTQRSGIPPMPVKSASKTAFAAQRTDTARSVVVPPMPALITIGWDKVAVGAETEVWQSHDLRTWNLLAAVAGDRLTLSATNAQAAFKIRNRVSDGAGGYVYSDWCRKTQ